MTYEMRETTRALTKWAEDQPQYVQDRVATLCAQLEAIEQDPRAAALIRPAVVDMLKLIVGEK